MSVNVTLATENEFASLACDATIESFFSIATVVAPTFEFDETKERAGMDLVAVLDRSGSMAGAKMKMLHETVEMMIANLKPVDRLCLVAYDSVIETPLELTHMDAAGKQLALDRLKTIRDQGCTNLSGGMMEGLKKLTSREEITNEIASVLLMTDGLANEGVTDPAEIVRMATEAIKSVSTPINLFTFGYGADHDTKILGALASQCGGSYYFMETTDSIAQAFGDCLGGLMSVVAQNISVVLTAAEGVTINGITTHFKKSEEVPQKQYRITIGDLYSEERKDLLIDLRVGPVGAPMEQPLLMVQMEYVNILTHDMDRHESACTLWRTEPGSPNGSVSEKVDEQRNRVRTAQALERAQMLSDQGRLEDARQFLQATSEGIRVSMTADRATSIGYVNDLQTTMEHMKSESAYQSVGKKKMAVKAQKHWAQREMECEETESMQYGNSAKVAMRSMFKK